MNHRAGFSLVEVLVSVGLMAVLITLGMALLTQNRNLNIILDDVVADRETGSHVATLIRNDFQGMIAPMAMDKTLLVRENDKGHLITHFITSGRPTANDEGIVAPYSEVSYALKPNPTNSNLNSLYRRHDWFVDDDMEQGGQWELISDRIIIFELAFAGGETEMTRAWPDGQFPEQVTFYIEFLPPEFDIEEISIDPDKWEKKVVEETLNIN